MKRDALIVPVHVQLLAKWLRREISEKAVGLGQTGLARAIRTSRRRVNAIVLGKRAVTADTDLRLARYFGLSEGFFLGLRTDHDLMEAKRRMGATLEAITPRAA